MRVLVKTTFFSVLLGCFCLSFSFPQETKKPFVVSGYVTASESQEKMPFVNVYLKGSTSGTITNDNGYYSIKVQEGNAIIVFSYIGYQTQEKNISIKNNMELDIILVQNEEALQEVQVISQRKFFGNLDYGREIPIVKSIDIEKINSSNASDILHARIAGVWATKTSGAPGDQQKIRIRGQTSFFSSAEPLYVIDGVPVPIVNMASLGIGDLNIHDIESLTVLKDASSTALYGYQGSNGVVLIDTKQHDDSKLSFSYRTGIQKFDNFYDLMDTRDFLESLNVSKQTIQSSMYKHYPEYDDTLCSHDRQDEIFHTGKIQEVQLSGSGKIAKMNYYLSGNYTSHEGVIKTSSQDKYNFAARLGTTIKNSLAINASYRVSYQENKDNQNEYMGNHLIFEGITKAPCLECTPYYLLYDTVRSVLYDRNNNLYRPFNSLTTPEQMLENNTYYYNYLSNGASLMARYAISKNLKIDIMESAMLRNSDFSSQARFTQVGYKERDNYYFGGSVGAHVKSDERIALLNHQVNLSYIKSIGKHELNLSAAHRLYSDNIWWEADSVKNSIPEGFYLKNSMIGIAKTGSVTRKMASYITHVSYNFRKTYFISAIANISRIKEGMHIDYYTLFPSLSVNWNIAREPFFFKGNWMNEFSLFSNFGGSGNYPLNGLANDVFDKTDNNNLVIMQFANHHLKHESNTEINLGLKSTFLKYRLKLNAARYIKTIGNQIIMRDIPLYYAGGKIYVNMGDIDVNGYEFGFEAYPVKTSITEWSVAGNFSSSKQKVKYLPDHQNIQFISEDLFFPDFIIKEGGTLGDIYGYECLGRWTEKDQLAKDNNYINSAGYKFRNTDTTNAVLDAKDITVIGNSIPMFNWNLMSTFRYRAFSLDLVIYSVWGMQKYNATRAATFQTGVNRDVYEFYADSSKLINSFKLYQSSYFIDDASFVRLKSVTFSYEPEKKLFGIHYLFSLSFENLLTFTHYRGYDPEAAIYTDNNFSDNAVDKGAYPNPRSVFATIKLSF